MNPLTNVRSGKWTRHVDGIISRCNFTSFDSEPRGLISTERLLETPPAKVFCRALKPLRFVLRSFYRISTFAVGLPP